MPDDDRATLPDGALPSNDELVSGQTTPPPLDAVPWLMKSHTEILSLGFDHREGFLLSLVDGRTNVETLLELAAMPRRVVLLMLARWEAMGVVELRVETTSHARRRGRT